MAGRNRDRGLIYESPTRFICESVNEGGREVALKEVMMIGGFRAGRDAFNTDRESMMIGGLGLDEIPSILAEGL